LLKSKLELLKNWKKRGNEMIHKNKWMMMLVALLAMILITGCAGNDTEDAAEKESAQETPAEDGKKEQEGNAQKSDEQFSTNEELTQKIEAEKGIERVMVQVIEGEERQSVNVDIEINEEQELAADKVIEKYGAMIKEQYPDHILDIIVVKEGKIQQQATID